MSWIKGTFFQPTKDVRLQCVEEEVALVKADVTRLKEAMEALNIALAENAKK